MRILALVIVLLIFGGACIDKIDIETGTPETFPVTVDGFISDQPGPYEVKLNKAFDIQSKIAFKTAISAHRVTIFDDHGNSEILTQVIQGTYRTKANGIRGTIGRAYKLRVELLDGRIYESIPDTLYRAGHVDSVYHRFKSEVTADGILKYGFDVYMDSSPEDRKNFRYMWQFAGTFQVETNPELYDTICEAGRCPLPLACSSYILNTKTLELEYAKLCDCCTCWTTFFGDELVLSDNEFVVNGRFNNIKVAYVPVSPWTFMYKVYSEVSQLSLSQQAFDFWRAVKRQKNASGSLFQPITGKVPANFVQLSGTTAPVEGLFYATAVVTKAIYITRNDVSPQSIIPPQDLPYKNSCLKLFPNSTLTKPSFWVN